MKLIVFILLFSTISVFGAPVDWQSMEQAAQRGDGRAVVLERRAMRRVAKPTGSRFAGSAIVQDYADGRSVTNAVRIVSMNPEARARVEALLAERETLTAAKGLAMRMRSSSPKVVKGLADAEIVAAADKVLDTSGKGQAAAGVIGAAFGAAAAAIAKGKKGKGNS